MSASAVAGVGGTWSLFALPNIDVRAAGTLKGMQLVEDDTCLNSDFVPNLPADVTAPEGRLDAFRQASTGRLAVHYMVIAIADDAFAAPTTQPALRHRFVEYFGDALAAQGHDAADVFNKAFEACLAKQLVFGTEEAGYFGGFRPSRRP
jgi:hypothetical protein